MSTSCLVLLNKVPQNVYPLWVLLTPMYVPKVFLCLVRAGLLLFLFLTHHTPDIPVRYRVIVLSL